MHMPLRQQLQANAAPLLVSIVPLHPASIACLSCLSRPACTSSALACLVLVCRANTVCNAGSAALLCVAGLSFRVTFSASPTALGVKQRENRLLPIERDGLPTLFTHALYDTAYAIWPRYTTRFCMAHVDVARCMRELLHSFQIQKFVPSAWGFAPSLQQLHSLRHG